MRNPSILFVLTCLPIAALAQHQPPPPHRADLILLDKQSGTQVDSSPSPDVRRYKGNVRLRQQGILLFCDRAVHQLSTNRISAAGHVLLVQNDSLTVKSDSLVYDGNSRQALLLGHVLFQHGQSVLTASQLDYDLRAGTVRYKGKGRLASGRSIQTLSDGLYAISTRQLVASQVNNEQPRSNVPDQLPASDAVTTRRGRRSQEDNRPVRLTMSPQPNNIVTNAEYVGTYKRQVRVSQRPLLPPTTSPSEPTPDESDLEYLLNRKKRAF
ncbi:OstA-like protein [Fibrella arboris]|uniref:OstA-like protein n=1 Tax=Fibrella arboris TaxID=3242486 RepID=UPI00352134B0